MHSDHHPISVSTEGWNTQKPHYTFIFQPIWLTHATFRPTVDCCWNSHNPHVMESQNFTTLFYSKIHHMQSCLTRWNSKTFGEIGCNKKRLRARILGIQKVLCTKHSRFLVTLERDLIHQYNIILYQEHLLWQMKSRMLWLTYGDANTKFFQLQTKIHRARQHIATLKDDTGEWLHGTQLHTHVTNHFQNLFQMTNPHNTLPPPTETFQAVDFNLNFFQNTLTTFPSTKEIRTTLWSIHS